LGLEEQNRLQKEALELEKKKLAQEQERLKLDREQQVKNTTQPVVQPSQVVQVIVLRFAVSPCTH